MYMADALWVDGCISVVRFVQRKNQQTDMTARVVIVHSVLIIVLVHHTTSLHLVFGLRKHWVQPTPVESSVE